MMQEGVIGVTDALSAPWFYASNSPPAARAERPKELLPIYKPYLAMGDRIGQALEIATYRALCMLPNAGCCPKCPKLPKDQLGKSF